MKSKYMAFVLAFCGVLLVFALSGGPGQAQMMNEGKHTFRSTEDYLQFLRTTYGEQLRSFPIPPLAICLLPEIRDLPQPILEEAAELLKTSPMLTEVKDSREADLCLSLNSKDSDSIQVNIKSPKGHEMHGQTDFALPQEKNLLRKNLEGRARLQAVSSAQGQADLAGLEWTIKLYTPADKPAEGGLELNGKHWVPAEEIVIAKEGLVQKVSGPALLAFSFANKGQEDLFVHLLNYTFDGGQILSVLPPLEEPEMSFKVEAGKQLNPKNLHVALTAPVEDFRLIISPKPVDVFSLVQENFSSELPISDKNETKPLAETEWRGLTVRFNSLTAK